MTNSQKINCKIEELRKKAAELISVQYTSPAMKELNKQMHNSLQDQIVGLEMARDIIEKAS